MKIALQKHYYRSAHDIMADDFANEIDNLLLQSTNDIPSLSRIYYNHLLKELFKNNGWQNNPSLFHEPVNPFDKIELVKNNIGLEIGFRHASLTGHNLLKFQLSPVHNSDKIDMGIFVVTTHNFQKQMRKTFGQNWSGAMTFEKTDRYLRNFKTTLQIPIFLIGIDAA
ncbi:BglII/BstYI family type II restriction endonuclease [Desulfotomaculum sp. 1211_IL3151]|uniref:BglII/BstYI family type II restriction endonuclease n=1 Tax=Desulfotomaculum sp. 1211_IL3151 TaxID=3084055 RepID=UPI002FD96E93